MSAAKTHFHNAVRGEAWTEFLLYSNGFTVASPSFAALREVLARREMPAPR
jgi:hypothetical protein